MIPLLLAAAAVLTPVESRGRELYLNGGASMEAMVGGDVITAPLPCAGCHGADGRGRTEGGVRAPEITWDALSHPTDGRATSGRARGSYDQSHLVRAITLGFDSSGHALAAPMPRYRLSREDAEALVAFLRRLGTLRDPGISDGALRIGVLLPAGSSARVLRAAIDAWARSVNDAGGLYTRRLEIRYLDGSFIAEGEASPTSGHGPFATTDGGTGYPRGAVPPSAENEPFVLIGQGDDRVASWTEMHEVPFVRTGGETSSSPPRRFVFQVWPAPADEVTRLVSFAASRGALPLTIAGAGTGAPLVACRAPGCRLTSDLQKARAVLFLDVTSMQRAPRRALALVPSWLADEAIAAPLGETIIAARAVPSDVDPGLAAAYHLAPEHLADQWSLLAGARVTEEILRRAGAGVTRESFVAALQSARQLATGFSPPVTFDTDRSRGTTAVRLLRVDRARGTLAPVE